MNSFIEQLIAKKMTPADYCLGAAIVLGALVVAAAAFLILGQFVGGVSMFVSLAALYGGYWLLSSRSIEFEYIVTNGAIDIDKIIAKRKRKRIFSAVCKDFEILARAAGRNPESEAGQARKVFAAGSMGSDGLYYALLHWNGARTVLYFEPDQRILDNFKRYIPSKIVA